MRFKTREAAKLAGIETGVVVEAPWIGGTTAVARIDWDATRVALVSARSPGVITSIEADVGAPVARGGAQARVRSAGVGGDRSRVAAAGRVLEVAEAERERRRSLLEAGVTSQREVLASEQAVASARADLGALEAELAEALEEGLHFDLEERTVAVVHRGSAQAVLAHLEPLGFDASLEMSVDASGELPPEDPVAEARVLRLLLVINGALFVVELGMGFWAQSTSLIADSLDMLADAMVYGLSLYAVRRG